METGTTKKGEPYVVFQCQQCNVTVKHLVNGLMDKECKLCNSCAIRRYKKDVGKKYKKGPKRSKPTPRKQRRRPSVRHIERVIDVAFFIDRDGRDCQICLKPLRLDIRKPNHPLYTTLDHIKPKSKKGNSFRENLRLVHRKCNEDRGNNDTPVQLILNLDVNERSNPISA